MSHESLECSRVVRLVFRGPQNVAQGREPPHTVDGERPGMRVDVDSKRGKLDGGADDTLVAEMEAATIACGTSVSNEREWRIIIKHLECDCTPFESPGLGV